MAAGFRQTSAMRELKRRRVNKMCEEETPNPDSHPSRRAGCFGRSGPDLHGAVITATDGRHCFDNSKTREVRNIDS
jgi:hypothetical protein